MGHRLVWTRQNSGSWWGTPPKRWRVAEVHHRGQHVGGLTTNELIAEWWIVVTFFDGNPEREDRFPSAEVAMRFADSVWDAWAAARRI